MKSVLNSVLKFSILTTLSFILLRLVGGGMQILWQPYQLLMIVGSTVTLLAFTKAKFGRAISSQEFDERLRAFRHGVAFGALASTTLGAAAILVQPDTDREALLNMLAHNAMAPYIASLIYVSFRPKAFVEKVA